MGLAKVFGHIVGTLEAYLCSVGEYLLHLLTQESNTFAWATNF
jgi:hypothetical protein